MAAIKRERASEPSPEHDVRFRVQRARLHSVGKLVR